MERLEKCSKSKRIYTSPISCIGVIITTSLFHLRNREKGSRHPDNSKNCILSGCKSDYLLDRNGDRTKTKIVFPCLERFPPARRPKPSRTWKNTSISTPALSNTASSSPCVSRATAWSPTSGMEILRSSKTGIYR